MWIARCVAQRLVNHTLVPHATTSGMRRHRRPSRGVRRLRAIGLVACLAVLAIAIAAVTLRSTHVKPEGPPVDAASDDDQTPEGISDRFPNTATITRADYRYSVIPGGAFNERELRRAITADPVVAAHYTQLDQSRIRSEIVARDRFVHVSYRKGNQIFWTKKKLLLRRGETILTDGTTQIRARCGNCISEEPLAPTAQEDPDIIEFDRLTDDTPELDSGTIEVGFAQPVAPKPTHLSGGAVADPVQQDARLRRSIGEGLAPSGSAGGLGGGLPFAQPIPTGTDGSPSASGRRSSPRPTPPPAALPQPTSSPVVAPTSVLPFVPGFVSLSDNSFLRSDGSAPPLDEIIRVTAGLNATVANDPLDLPHSGEPINPVPVPEPGTLLMVGGGVAAVVRKLRARARDTEPGTLRSYF